MAESDRALEAAGTNGLAIYAALHKWRFLTPPAHRASFFCSEANIAHHCGLSTRRLRDPLRALERAGLVKIIRPVGREKVMHQASKITLLPVFVTSNKSGDRLDALSGRDGQLDLSKTGREVPPTLSVIRETTEGKSPPLPLAGGLGGRPRGRDEPGQPAIHNATTLRQQATNNTKEQFAASPDLDTELTNAIVDALDAHTSMSTQALNSADVRRGIKEILLTHVKLWEILREIDKPAA